MPNGPRSSLLLSAVRPRWSTGVTDPLTEADLTEEEVEALKAAGRLMIQALDNE